MFLKPVPSFVQHSFISIGIFCPQVFSTGFVCLWISGFRSAQLSFEVWVSIKIKIGVIFGFFEFFAKFFDLIRPKS